MNQKAKFSYRFLKLNLAATPPIGASSKKKYFFPLYGDTKEALCEISSKSGLYPVKCSSAIFYAAQVVNTLLHIRHVQKKNFLLCDLPLV